ncbi:hypothetical protein PLEOSDRAFT_1088423 [Pleurotus ostreatus PC15]|uniref:Uncharacterized protein n=2 Tax=Pleurotus TaxID=5320 RepID=A0A067P3T8_PLEO1|nr:hypothetical protein CCMSSC00406_0000266 [Pleurotus cornucopiae]KDQ30546.1 hypothetical protein PLEOSDRAFT_1088423 [Pleurotus ostreatus PC15]
MSGPYPNDSAPYQQHRQHAPYQQEYKASYDDLIDEYATPYGATSGHKTFNVETPLTSDLRRGPTISGLQKPTQFSSKQSEETDFGAPYVGYPPPVPLKEIDTRTFWQKWLPESIACRLYVFTVLIETTVDLAIEGELLVRINRQNDLAGVDGKIPSQKMPVYLSIFALAHVFQLVLAIDAVYARNTLQFIALTIFNALFLLYAIIQIFEIRTSSELLPDVTGISDIPINVLTTIIPIVISVAEICYIALGWKIYHEFGWKLYKELGADRRVKKMYANYQVFECLIKFDVFFWIGFSVQFIWLVLNKNDWEYYVTCAALPLSIVLLVEGHLAARHENKWMMATFMAGCVGAMVYFVYKLVKVLIYRNTDQFLAIYKTLSVFSMIAIVLLLATFAFAIIVMRNFGRGLKTSIKRKKTTKIGGSVNPHRRAASTNLNRMSID